MIAELGTDMSVFKSGAHLAAWAGVCPGNNESAGKRKRADTRKGNVHLMNALVEAAHGASRTKGSYFKGRFFRIKARRVLPACRRRHCAQNPRAVYTMLSAGAEYRDFGAAYQDVIDVKQVTGNLVRGLQRLGFDVTIAPRLARPRSPGPTGTRRVILMADAMRPRRTPMDENEWSWYARGERRN